MVLFYFVIAVLLGLPGLILFLLGLINKKPAQWITGIVIILIALFIAIYSIARVVVKSVNAIDKFSRWEKRNSPSHNYDTYDYENTKDSFSLKDAQNEEKEISGFIKGIDNKLTLIHVKLNKQLEMKGLGIDKIEDYTPQSIKKNGIPLTFNFTENFNGRIILSAYNSNNYLVSECSISCIAQKGDIKKVDFNFEKNVIFSDIKYCILYESE